MMSSSNRKIQSPTLFLIPIFLWAHTDGSAANQWIVNGENFFFKDSAYARESLESTIVISSGESICRCKLSSARWLEPLAMLWIYSAYKAGLGTDWAFAVARRGK